ncbi:MAG: DUF805 domain-containing protein [Asticcacaulis sp.]|uniref:DUF805 domain-containing protein n=1 Tax=Asticcacaulis sp. TaxID=1872648 RepID=UPI003F7B4739
MYSKTKLYATPAASFCPYRELDGLVATASHISIPPIKFIVTLFFLLPSLAVGARRLHDINRTGWWLLLLLTGFGAIGLIVLLIWPSQKDDEAIAQVF